MTPKLLDEEMGCGTKDNYETRTATMISEMRRALEGTTAILIAVMPTVTADTIVSLYKPSVLPIFQFPHL